jgi:hypothetical protein
MLKRTLVSTDGSILPRKTVRGVIALAPQNDPELMALGSANKSRISLAFDTPVAKLMSAKKER